jgi:hypothetical protein
VKIRSAGHWIRVSKITSSSMMMGWPWRNNSWSELEKNFSRAESAQGVLKRRVASTEDAGGGGVEVLWNERNRRIQRPCSQWPSLGPFWRMRGSGPGRFRVLSHLIGFSPPGCGTLSCRCAFQFLVVLCSGRGEAFLL